MGHDRRTVKWFAPILTAIYVTMATVILLISLSHQVVIIKGISVASMPHFLAHYPRTRRIPLSKQIVLADAAALAAAGGRKVTGIAPTVWLYRPIWNIQIVKDGRIQNVRVSRDTLTIVKAG